MDDAARQLERRVRVYISEVYRGVEHVLLWKRAAAALGYEAGEGYHPLSMEKIEECVRHRKRKRWQPVMEAVRANEKAAKKQKATPKATVKPKPAPKKPAPKPAPKATAKPKPVPKKAAPKAKPAAKKPAAKPAAAKAKPKPAPAKKATQKQAGS